MHKIFAQFIPIFLIFFLLTESNRMAEFSHSVLGRLFAVCGIIFYTYLDKMVGLFVCSLVILYYQSGHIENMLNMKESFEQKSTELPDVNESNPDDSISAASASAAASTIDSNDIPSSVNNKKGKLANANYNELYNNDNDNNLINKDVMSQFRKQNCDKNVLKNKNMKVKNEMTEHIFPELKFKGKSCNACDETCQFSIIESKLKTELDMRPESSA